MNLSLRKAFRPIGGLGESVRRFLAGNTVFHKTNPHILFLLGPLAGLFLLWLVLTFLTCPLWRVIGPVSLCFLILSSAIFVSAVVFYLDWRFNRFYLTNFRLIKKRGVIGKKLTSIWLVKIQDITIQFGFWDRIFGFGDLLIESAGELGQERFKGLPNLLKSKK